MGYAMLMAPCLGCGRVFSSNPRKVPSKDNEPICRECMTLINEKRKTAGLKPFPIPDDAYEPIDEHEL